MAKKKKKIPGINAKEKKALKIIAKAYIIIHKNINRIVLELILL